MQSGRAPQRWNPDKGGMESMELSQEPIPFRDGGTEFVPRWPQDHAAIMDGGKPIPDPGGVPGALRWDVPGTMNGSSGSWELVVDPQSKTILHFLFQSAP